MTIADDRTGPAAAPTEASPSSANLRRAFQTYVSIYDPLPGSTPQHMQWKQFTAVSRELSSEGMSLVSRNDLHSPMVVIAFNPRAGTRLCLKAQVNRCDHLPEGAWRYDLAFRGKAIEPNTTASLGKL